MKCIRFFIIISGLLIVFTSCSKTEVLELETEIQSNETSIYQRVAYSNFDDGNTHTGEICTVDISLKEEDPVEENDRP